MFAAQLGLPGVFALFCEAGGVLVARVAADQAEILTLAVTPPARRGGLGRALVQQAADHAHEAGAARLFLEVGCANAAARALYARCGFLPVGLRRRYYADGGDAVVMALDLTCGAATGG
jgi:ribosomal-protein-alanine N-acetyltransferase